MIHLIENQKGDTNIVPIIVLLIVVIAASLLFGPIFGSFIVETLQNIIM